MSDDQKSGDVVKVDLNLPPKPTDPIDQLIDWLNGSYKTRRSDFIDSLKNARSLKNRSDIVELGFEAVLFRTELDPWLALVGELIDNAKADELSIAYQERQEEAEENKLKRPSAELVRAQAAQFVSPIKRVQKELQDTQDLLSKTLSWCQSLQKLLQADEFGDLYTATEQIPEKLIEQPPGLGKNIKNK